MASTRPLDLPLALPSRPLTASGAPRRTFVQRLGALVGRMRGFAVIEVDLDDLRLDEAALHADLADLFERGDG